MSGRLGTYLVWTVVLLLAAAAVTFVWPTPWRWDHMTVDGNVVPVRIHRITHHADMLLPDDGWVPVEAPPGATAEPMPSAD